MNPSWSTSRSSSDPAANGCPPSVDTVGSGCRSDGGGGRAISFRLLARAPVHWAAVTRRFHVRTFGCQMNEHDSERIAGLLAADGMEPSDLDHADVVVLNTCCIRENADNKLYGHLGHLAAVKRARPELQIAVAGCLAQKDRELIREKAPHVDVVFGTHNVHRAAELLDRARRDGPVVEILEEHLDDELFPSALPARREVRHAAWVTIQIGCDNTCAFCIVPAVRGREISRRMGDIVREVETLAADGVSEITLLGQNVNSYGRDLGAGQWRPRFADLLRAVDAVDGIRRVRYTSPHPKDLRPETIAAMAECSTVCEHLHLPLQAGSDRVLARMHRGYTAERYLERLMAARAAVPDLAVTTDVIVGFPGETEDDFQRTLDVCAEADYDGAYTFIFSPRPGTEAASMVDEFVPAEVAGERLQRLVEVIERSGRRRHQARVGRTEEILVEGPSKRDAAVLTSRTRQNKLVHVPGTWAPGTYARARIAAAGAHHLVGEVVDETGRPRRSPVRIAVRAG
jgi:tRNA-2-methylthio-N6-dimethylallyladenosine synthase